MYMPTFALYNSTYDAEMDLQAQAVVLGRCCVKVVDAPFACCSISMCGWGSTPMSVHVVLKHLVLT